MRPHSILKNDLVFAWADLEYQEYFTVGQQKYPQFKQSTIEFHSKV